jgi:hypothetical protein
MRSQLRIVPGKDRSPLRFTSGLKLRITKTASGYARGQYRATLQASFIHRLFLRCGRIHSGEERNIRENITGEFIRANKEEALFRIR